MRFRRELLLAICFILTCNCYAQSASVVQGAVFCKSTNIRLAGVSVLNKKTNNTVRTNNLGLFSIVASTGDTLVFSVLGYLKKQIVLSGLQDQIVYLQQSNELEEVSIRARTIKADLMEVEKSFRSKGIYYKGKPPLKLLSPLGGSPLTFFHELLSKDGKRARRWSRYADQQLEYYTIAARFSDNAIKKVVPILEEELPDFKEAYWPRLENINAWNDFELYAYIKESYNKFKESSERSLSK